MKIIVTGGAGFIGSHIVDRLLEEGNEVLAIDNFSLGTKKHIEHNLGNVSFKFVELDITKQDELNAVFSEFRPECVFHMAANSDIRAGSKDIEVDLSKTFNTTVSILKAMEKYNTKQLVFASTSAIYGFRKGKISEVSGPLIPESNYGASKLASEAFIFAFANLRNIKTWVFRFPNVCGARGTHGVFIDFLRFLKKDSTRITVAQDGNQAKPYIYVLDLVDAIMLGWSKSRNLINVYNIGNTPLVSVNEILWFLLKEKGIQNINVHYTHEPAWPGDISTYMFDDSKIRALGYVPKYNSREAAEKTARELVHDPKASIAVYRE